MGFLIILSIITLVVRQVEGYTAQVILFIITFYLIILQVPVQLFIFRAELTVGYQITLWQIIKPHTSVAASWKLLMVIIYIIL